VRRRSRREFLKETAAGAAVFGGFGLGARSAFAGPTTRSAVFFNLSHEDGYAKSNYYLVAGGRRYRLRTVKSQRVFLERERENNSFLQRVPDASVTHFVPNLELPENAVVLGYLMKLADVTSGPAAGTWSMSGIHFHLPETAVRAAHKTAVSRTPDGLLPKSTKRALYGHAAAQNAKDFVDEQSLKDLTDHATALISLHPEVLSAEPKSAAHIQMNLVQASGGTLPFALKIGQLGAAEPQANAGHLNDNGWATLTPFTDEHGTALKNTKGRNAGLILYNPEWHPDVARMAGGVMRSVVQQVKDDTTLGADITSTIAAGAGPDLTGKLWLRRDGLTRIDQPANGVSAEQAERERVPYAVMGPAPQPGADTCQQGAFTHSLTPSTPFNGYSVDAEVTTSPTGKPHVKLSFENWYLRWLGLYILFLDADEKPIPMADLPPELRFSPPGSQGEVFLGFMSPTFTVLGIPIIGEDSTATAEFDFPDKATHARILASGLGTGSHEYPATEAFGTGMTGVFNLAVPPLILALGAGLSLEPITKGVTIPLVQASVQEVLNFFYDVQSDIGFKNLLTTLIRALKGIGSNVLVRWAVEAYAEYIVEDEVEDAIPLAGAIMQAIGALSVVAQLAETSCEALLSPWTYVSGLSLTHDVCVTIKPDSDHDTTTPAAATTCKVVALFDNGATPRVQNIPLDGGKAELPVTFRQVPRGGKITVSAAFYQASGDDPHHTLLGNASSGLVDNTVETLSPIETAELKHVLGPTTCYQHTQKTGLDVTGKLHVWVPSKTAPTDNADPLSRHPVSDPCAVAAGTVCDFRSITVRQGSAVNPGYLGYAWHGYRAGCSGGTALFDGLGNGNTGENAGTGYATAPCGLDPGVKLVYSLLGQKDANFYADPKTRRIRGVTLDPTPSFDPSTDMAWGTLNFDSTSLLLHPTGVLVNVNDQNHRLETLKIPASPLAGPESDTKLLARVHGGQGSRPGLLQNPRAAAVTPDGVILVLEADNQRIQAFDIGGNSVQYFGKQKEPYFLRLDATASGDTVYLDLAVENTGYVYVLSYNQAQHPFPYRLDVYGPGQSGTSPLFTTHGFNAARVAVDFWRNVYSLNYETVKKPDGTLPELAEPTVSLWVPNDPC
jgi:hypothetical protein